MLVHGFQGWEWVTCPQQLMQGYQWPDPFASGWDHLYGIIHTLQLLVGSG